MQQYAHGYHCVVLLYLCLRNMRKRNGVNHEKKVAEFSQGAVYAYTIQNEAIHMTALNFGAVITELKTSDRSGNMENVVAAFSDIMDYERQQGPYLNAVVAPVAGRIAYGSYSMENTVHQLSINNGCHHLHGGTGGISRQLFHV